MRKRAALRGVTTTIPPVREAGCQFKRLAQQAHAMHSGERLRRTQAGGESCGEHNYPQSGRGTGIHWYDSDMKSERESLQHRPFLTPIWLSAIGAFVALSLAVFAVWIWGTANSTTVIVIRHAEKESGGPVDPPLSAAGEARAALLARMFGDAKGPGRLDAIYVSPAVRSRSTAAPLAARLGLTPIVAPADDAKAWRIGYCESTAAGGS